jgi:hypothetical protein
VILLFLRISPAPTFSLISFPSKEGKKWNPAVIKKSGGIKKMPPPERAAL